MYMTPNAIDAGDAPPSRPSRRRSNNMDHTDQDLNVAHGPSIDEVRSNATRLLLATERHPSFRMTATSTRQTESIVIQVESDRGQVTSNGTSGFGNSNNTASHVNKNTSRDQECDATHSDTAASVVSTNSDEYNGGAVTDEDTDLAYGSLPSVEEARLYAGFILDAAKSSRDMSPESSERFRLTLSPFRGERQQNEFDDYNYDNDATNIVKNDDGSVFLSKGIPITTPPHILEKRKRCLRLCLLGTLVIALIAVVIGVAAYVSQSSQQPQQGASQPPSTGDSRSAPSSRLDATISFLTHYSISHRDNLEDMTRPQYLAAVWIADYDALAYEIPYTHLDDTYVDFVQRYALAVMYFSLNGNGWVNQNLFLDKVHVCGWYSVDTLNDGEDIALGVSCNDRGEVSELLIPRNNMVGTLPMELSHLSSLHFLDFNRNAIQGTIPQEYSNLERMQFFDLRYNQLTGSIPLWIGGAWDELTEFALSNNNLTGSIPESLRYLERLRSLSLAQNHLNSTLASIVGLSSLQFLYLDNNRFTGLVDEAFLSDMGRLVQVDLSSNQLEANDIPVHLFQYPFLEVLDLGDNSLMGSIPVNIPENTVLQFLSFSDNILTGSLPDSITQLKALQHLDITGNDMNGEIPSSLATMESLAFLFLSQNQFTEGPIPDFLSGMDQLRELSLSSTKRNGTLSADWLTGLRELVLLDLSWNELSGTVPPTIWEHPSLQYLLLNRNQLTGDFPLGVTDTMLQLLLLDKNGITGDLSTACQYGVNYISADCEEITCGCCKCCNDDNVRCNQGVWDFNQEFSWEQNYTRVSYAFSPVLLEDPIPSGR